MGLDPPPFLRRACFSGGASIQSAELAAYCVAAMHIVGAVASSTMGHLSDLSGAPGGSDGTGRSGRSFSMIFGWLIAAPLPILVGG